ncbi:MAG: hypothetical protein V1781_09665 [Bacteroidota bacterium]
MDNCDCCIDWSIGMGSLDSEKIGKSKIDIKIVSLVYAPNQTYTNRSCNLTINGIGYFLKINLTVLHKDFYQKNLIIYVKYPTRDNYIKSEIFVPSNYSITLENNRLTLNIDKSKLLQFNSIIPKNKITSNYVTFIVDKANYEDFESIKFEFIDFSFKTREFIIKRSEMDFNNILFENEIWN